MRRRITKAEYDERGGMRNSSLFRVQRRGRWFYYSADHKRQRRADWRKSRG